VTPFPGVIRRADSTAWWFALRAPQDLLHRFDGGPWAARCSLKTRDLREANTKARMGATSTRRPPASRSSAWHHAGAA